MQFESIEGQLKNQSDSSERKLVDKAVKYLQQTGHANVRPLCLKIVSGPGGRAREIDAAAIADNCALVVEHKNLMDSKGADQLASVVEFIE